MNDEWIPMDSSRLRIAEACTYELGEKCMARWSDCRKFPATIQKILENGLFTNIHLFFKIDFDGILVILNNIYDFVIVLFI